MEMSLHEFLSWFSIFIWFSIFDWFSIFFIFLFPAERQLGRIRTEDLDVLNAGKIYGCSRRFCIMCRKIPLEES